MPKAKIQLKTLVKRYKQAYLPPGKKNEKIDKDTPNPEATKTVKPIPT